jgi:protein-tyrosine phosphatase
MIGNHEITSKKSTILRNTLNFREIYLGGVHDYIAKTLFRSGDLSKLELDEAKFIRNNLGICTYLDLRSHKEVKSFNSLQNLLDANINLYHCPIENYSNTAIFHTRPSAQDYTHYYLDILTTCSNAFIKALEFIEEHLPNPLVFGCFAGKDRTGLLAASILECLSVARKEIINDFILSTPELLACSERFRDKWVKKKESPEDYIVRLNARSDTMQLLFQELDTSYGGLINFLIKSGMSPELPLLLQSKMRRISNSSHE